MGGKGRRRREKNYREAHGGKYTRLPPPPDPSSVDALPSKLRKLISLTNSSSGSAKDNEQRKKTADNSGNKELSKRENFEPKNPAIKGEDHLMAPKRKDASEDHNNADEKGKRKRKRKHADDPLARIAMEELGDTGSKKKDRRKKYWEAKRKKQKKGEAEEDIDFPGHERIEFGDIVKAPPKLDNLPKKMKTVQDASRERLRLKAVEAYRSHKGWVSRPGIKLPAPMTSTPT
ncbi:hypothetical protein RJ641_016140 [Dillenia turbinata]|uniref:Uncharacterized protein n=1 Tax=Dillenia turbinata TaxID=194707 RepID=A0AAN8Z0R1_9MAGN